MDDTQTYPEAEQDAPDTRSFDPCYRPETNSWVHPDADLSTLTGASSSGTCSSCKGHVDRLDWFHTPVCSTNPSVRLHDIDPTASLTPTEWGSVRAKCRNKYCSSGGHSRYIPMPTDSTIDARDDVSGDDSCAPFTLRQKTGKAKRLRRPKAQTEKIRQTRKAENAEDFWGRMSATEKAAKHRCYNTTARSKMKKTALQETLGDGSGEGSQSNELGQAST